MISIIIPTYNEKENIEALVPRILRVMKKHRLVAEVIVVDDNSPDGTSDSVKGMETKFPVKLVKRRAKLGLSSAVVEGLKMVEGDIIGVMDADLSHPPEKIPLLLKQLKTHDLVFASRHVKGGGAEWTPFRRTVSKIATLLARGLTPIKDPMSGFFFFNRKIIKVRLNPKGYKIGLEIAVKSGTKKISEVPFFFVVRQKGKSKLGIAEVIDYLFHLSRLYAYVLKRKLT